MREHVQSYVIKVILFVIIGAFVGTIFLVWGMGGASKGDKEIVAYVYEKPIYAVEFNRKLQNLKNFYRQIYRDKFSEAMIKELGLKQQALDGLIQERILLHEAADLGLEVTQEELVSRIKSISTFQENGVFDPFRYKQILKVNNLTPSQYELGLREAILSEKVEMMIKDRAKVSEKEIRDLYVFNNEKITADYLVFSPDLFKDKVKVGEEELKSWFEKNKENYRIGEKRSFSYIIVNQSDFRDKVQIADDELEEYYQFNEQKYYKEPQVKASHILLKVPATAKPEEIEATKKKIEDLRSRILAGESFAKLAKKYSEDEATKKKGGDLGFFSSGHMVPAFEEVAFNLEPGKISEPIKTPYGFHLIKVTDKKEGGLPLFDEVKDEIKKEMTQEKEKEMAEDMADMIYAELIENPDLGAIAKKYSLQVKDSPAKTKEEIRNREEAEALFDLELGQVAGVFRLGKSLKIDKLEKISPSRIPELAEVQDKVKEDLVREKASKIAEQDVQNALKKLRDGSQTFEKLAKSYNTKVKQAKDITRRGYIPTLNKLDDPIYPLFDLKVNEFSEPFHKEDDVVLFQIKEKKKIDEEKYNQDKNQTIGSLLTSKKEEIFNAWLASRRKLAQVQEEQQFLN